VTGRRASLAVRAAAIALTLAGCGIRPGLANAPSMNRARPDNRPHDVITNGNDSCERDESGSPLREHTPPCETAGKADLGAGLAGTSPP
jgi:hypothetical protein